MGAVDRTAERIENTPNLGAKEIVITSGTTVAGGVDYVTLTLADWGISKVLAVQEFVHTTTNEVIVETDPESTEVTSGVLKIVVADHSTPGDWDNMVRVLVVKGI